MIPAAFVTAWSARAPWPTPAQVEQDLLLSRVLIAMYQDDYLSNELVFRGGTCLHKLHLPVPRRYSEAFRVEVDNPLRGELLADKLCVQGFS